MKPLLLPSGLISGLAKTPWGLATLAWDPQTSWIYSLTFQEAALPSPAAQQLMDNILKGRASFKALGTPFQQKVWEALCEIPWAHTVMYSDLAVQIGAPRATRAVANAVARNPISWLIPCHRVLPKAGGIGNYHWGSSIKAMMLAYEQENSQPKLPL